MSRWLVVTDDFPPLDGGVATWTAAAAGALAAAGHEVTVLARARAGLGEGLPYRVIGVRGPSFGRRGGAWLAVAAAPRLAWADRVLATTWTVATWVAPLVRRLGVPLDVVAHGSDVTRRPRDAAGFGRVFRPPVRAWAVSGFLRDALAARGVAAGVLPPPVDADAAPRPPGDGSRWVMVGRATPLKGGDRFVRLVALAGARGTVYGDGPELVRWRELAVGLGADVTFRGRVPRDTLAAELPAHDVAFLLPRTAPDGSGGEGYGLALVEAAARGLATVGCRTGGVPEAVGAGLLLADPDDAERSVAEVRAWGGPSRGAACHAWVRDHAGTARLAERLVGSTPGSSGTP